MEVMAKNRTMISQQHLERQKRILLYTSILLSSFLWCTLIISVPFLLEGSTLSQKIAIIITLFLSPLCHQAVERSFHILGHPLSVCVRCTGIYLGFLLGVILYPLFRHADRHSIPSRRILLLGVLPSALEFLILEILFDYPIAVIRAATGAVLGGVVAFYIIPALFNAFHSPKTRLR